MTQLRNQENGSGWVAVCIPGIGVQYEPATTVVQASASRTDRRSAKLPGTAPVPDQVAHQPKPTQRGTGREKLTQQSGF